MKVRRYVACTHMEDYGAVNSQSPTTPGVRTSMAEGIRGTVVAKIAEEDFSAWGMKVHRDAGWAVVVRL